MTVPAILMLESVKPLAFIGSQALYFFEPMVRALFTIPEYERFAALMERRDNVEALLVRIETKDEAERRAERERRDKKRAERKTQKRGKEAP
jgi:phenylacetate-coenzyme A ligase PaaK-like adenylate-forming protein